jgi:predicted dehydrogenase
MIGVAVVGVGGYGAGLIEQLNRMGESCGCRLLAAADANLPAMPEQAEALRRRGVKLYDDAVAMFRQQAVPCQAVFIASSIPTHTELTVQAARCGLHVNLEKPPAATVQEVDEMLEELRRAGRFCQVGFQAFHGHMRLLIDRLAEGKLGRVKTLSCVAGWPRNRQYYTRNNWAGRLRLGNRWVLDGPATNALAHQLAHMLGMAAGRAARLATPSSVRAELYAAGPEAIEGHNLAAMEVRTVEGPVIRFYCSHATKDHFGPRIDVDAEGGQGVYSPRDGCTITYADGTSESRPAADNEQAEMIANFAEAVARNDPAGLRCPLAETRSYVLALDGAHESSGRIHRIAPEHWRLESPGTDDQRVVVDGLDDLLPAAARQAVLFSDLPAAPAWAVRTQPYDLAGYAGFPQRFRGE